MNGHDGRQTNGQDAGTSVAVFGGGCFWCTEAVFGMIKGVTEVTSGYAGGRSADPSYEDVSTGSTGHAEVVRVRFDPLEVSYRDLLDVFFGSHDPTTPDRQGHDVGTQYRSVILFTDETQRRDAETYIADLERETGIRVVTQLEPLGIFYPAEDYHKEYYANNRAAPYCRAVIDPKLAKLRKRFSALLKGRGGRT